MRLKILGLLGIITLALIAFWIYQKRPGADLKKPLSEGQKKAIEYDYDWIVWQDPAGFSFDLPAAATVNAHPEDKENYAHLELSQAGHPGKVEIICNDSPYADLEQWLAEDERASQGNSLETNIASLSARKIALGSGHELAALIDWDEVIYLIEMEAEDRDYWLPVYRQILSSFKLIPLEGESESEFTNWLKGFDTANVDWVEPVEIIE